MIVEQEEHLDLARGQCRGDLVGHTGAAPLPSRTCSSKRRAIVPESAASPCATPSRNEAIRSGGSVFRR